LLLNPDKTRTAPTCDPQSFLGFELLAGGGRRRLPANVSRFRNRLELLRSRWLKGEVSPDEVRSRVGSWIAHAAHADTVHLRLDRPGAGLGDGKGSNKRQTYTDAAAAVVVG
jgi:RNA-directed DNA polymerase